MTDTEAKEAKNAKEYEEGVKRCLAELPQGLTLVDLPQSRPGFRQFISSWFFVDGLGRRVVVDPGPASTVPLLLENLSSLTNGVDLVLVTHIHIDHSGGIGQFCARFPDAKVVAHPKGVRHLIEPGKLWRHSLDVLGDLVAMYGEPAPLDPARLLDGLPGVTVLETPGHAPHHVTYIVPFGDGRLFFAGESAGLSIPLPKPYFRPTTPPKFDGAAEQRTLRLLAEALQDGDTLCYAHWGAARDPLARLALAEQQLASWLSLASQMRDQPEEVVMERLLAEDPLLSGYAALPKDVKEREDIFIRNSVKGVLMCLEERKA
ncbi:MAG: MBL fold metallo-hydrolase [Synergistaceae bacterium]|jgi:glyoxylase-like metal-dependent hydrolase (beta-lactamase superfamily II)|nr:MBL fold metallo-hydrolase [Synergistaceae bacterium]